MNVSKLKISQETRAKLNNPALTPIKKRELREQLIKEHIRGAAGKPMMKQELVGAAGHNSGATTPDYAKGLGLVQSMIKRGIISHNPTKTFKKIWTVCEDVRTTSIKNPAGQLPIPIIPRDITVIREAPTEVDRVKLIDMAKQWAWDNNSDSLRDFISYAHNSIK